MMMNNIKKNAKKVLNDFKALLGKDKNTQVRTLQKIIIGAVILFLLGVFIIPNIGGSGSNRSSLEEVVSITTIDGVEAEDRWLETASGQVTKLEEEIQSLTASVNKSLEKSNALNAGAEKIQRDWNQAVERQKNKLNEMEQRIEQLVRDAVANAAAAQVDTSGLPSNAPFAGGVPVSNEPPPAVADPAYPVGPQDVGFVPPTPSVIKFVLAPSTASKADDGYEIADRNPDNWVPAGAHAPAVIVTGADATTSVSGQGDPRPITLRITGPAVTAASKSGSVLKTELTGCTATGEARGDLSSERVYIRLLRMTCRDDDRIIETSVRGFVAGQGQTGVRGPVVNRDGSLVNYAFLGAFAEGLGGGLSAGFAIPTVVDSEGAEQINALSDQEVIARSAKSGIASGFGGAGAQIADYYIKRAEQYQPVVSLKGGTVVEVVFLEGTWIDGRINQ